MDFRETKNVHDKSAAHDGGEFRNWVGQCFLSVAHCRLRGVHTPWLLWYYCGSVDSTTWSDHLMQLLVCVDDDAENKVRPSVARALQCFRSRSTGTNDLVPVMDWEGPRLDDSSPVYVIPEVNMLTWWYSETFKVKRS